MKLKPLLVAAALAGAFTSANALTVVSGNVPQIDSNLVRNPVTSRPEARVASRCSGRLNDNHSQLVSAVVRREPRDHRAARRPLDSTDGTFSQLSISLFCFRLDGAR